MTSQKGTEPSPKMSEISQASHQNASDPCRGGKGCCDGNTQCTDPREDPLEFALGVALFVMVVGIILVTMGYVIPRDWKVDPDMAARKMEAIEKYYIELNNALDICSIVGMTLIALGGVIMAVVITVLFCNGELLPICGMGPQVEEQEALVLTPRGSCRTNEGESKHYGSTDVQGIAQVISSETAQ